MSENAIDSENISKSAPDTAKPKGKRTPAKTAKPAKNARAKKPAAKSKTDRTNKKAEVIAMMKRAKGATLAEIMAATKWQAHIVRGFISILGSKGGEKIDSSNNRQRPQNQTFLMMPKRKAVVSPNSSHPFSASSAPMSCHWDSRTDSHARTLSLRSANRASPTGRQEERPEICKRQPRRLLRCHAGT